MQQYIKDPNDVLDYTRDASSWLATGETIASSSWEITGPDAVLVLGTSGYAPTSDTTTATCWLTGGTLGATYVVRNRITTNSSPARTKDLSFSVRIMQR
jgi:hypothetical protein